MEGASDHNESASASTSDVSVSPAQLTARPRRWLHQMVRAAIVLPAREDEVAQSAYKL